MTGKREMKEEERKTRFDSEIETSKNSSPLMTVKTINLSMKV